MNIVRPLVLTLLACAAACGAAEAPAAGPYKPEKGPLSVEVVREVMLHDEARDQDLPVAVVYPKEAGKYPLIVFSHGAGGSGTRVLELPQFWASHGYVVLAPTHADSIEWQRRHAPPPAPAPEARGDAPDPRDPRDALMNNIRGGKWDEHFIQRPADISFLINSIPELQKHLPELAGKIDLDRIGVGGHSLGAYTAQAAGGATVDIGDRKDVSLADDRIDAVLMLSGQGKGQMGLTERSWRNFTRPMLGITGSLDKGAGGQEASWRRDPFALSPPGDKYFLFIEGAHHASFTGSLADTDAEGQQRAAALRLRARFGERFDQLTPEQKTKLRQRAAARGGDQSLIFDYVQSATLAFWDAYLKADEAGRKYLNAESLPTWSEGDARLERR